MAAMALEKMTIRAETAPGEFGTQIQALFNPQTLTIAKATMWRRSPKPESDTSTAQFLYGEPATLTIELFFDTYEIRQRVTEYTQAVFALTTIQEHGELHRPPLCKLQWGNFNISDMYQCEWVLQNLNQQFSLFLADGTPVRATLGCTFRQWRSDAVEARLLDKQSADVAKTRTVRRGETLSSIAAEVYQDPTRWRPIAEANGLNDPRQLQPGQVLVIPTLRPPRTARRG
jgi:nucleoid-associated protein YgaU